MPRVPRRGVCANAEALHGVQAHLGIRLRSRLHIIDYLAVHRIYYNLSAEAGACANMQNLMLTKAFSSYIIREKL